MKIRVQMMRSIDRDMLKKRLEVEGVDKVDIEKCIQAIDDNYIEISTSHFDEMPPNKLRVEYIDTFMRRFTSTLISALQLSIDPFTGRGPINVIETELTSIERKMARFLIKKHYGKPEKALEYYQKALAIAEQLNDIKGKATELNNIGMVYQDWGKPEKALEYYQKALKIAEQLKDIRGKATKLKNIGNAYQDWGKPEKALEYYQKALKIFEDETKLPNLDFCK